MFMINVTIKVSELKSELEKKENLIENKLKELDIVTEKKVDLEKQVFSLFEIPADLTTSLEIIHPQ